MRLAGYFYNGNRNTSSDNEHDTPFHNKSTWNPPNDGELALNTFLDAVELDITMGKPTLFMKPYHYGKTIALCAMQRQDIMIKPADKGSGTVVMDKT